jgi:hypothetical protein
MTHPYSIYIWQPGKHPALPGNWIEPLQAYTQEYALYVANLIHKVTRAVIKVVRYGLNIAHMRWSWSSDKSHARNKSLQSGYQDSGWCIHYH